jgi:hypothetical protein
MAESAAGSSRVDVGPPIDGDKPEWWKINPQDILDGKEVLGKKLNGVQQ